MPANSELWLEKSITYSKKPANLNESVIPSFNLNSQETWKRSPIFETGLF